MVWSLFVIFAACVVGETFGDNPNKVRVDVYYESLCPDSIKFITKQLYPSLYTNISDYVNLTLIPFGKSKQFLNSIGQYEFNCSHGPDECVGNRIQACAIEKSDPDEGLGTNINTVGFINCLMDKVDRNVKPVVFPIKDCSEMNNIRNALEIQNCAKHPDGVNYLAKMGMKTQSLQPALTSVPTIVFNGEYKAEDSSLAQTDFKRAVCKYIRDKENLFDTCKSFGSMLQSSLIVSVVAYIFSRVV